MYHLLSHFVAGWKGLSLTHTFPFSLSLSLKHSPLRLSHPQLSWTTKEVKTRPDEYIFAFNFFDVKKQERFKSVEYNFFQKSDFAGL